MEMDAKRMNQFFPWMLPFYLAFGLALGTTYFCSLHWTSDRLAAGRGVPAAVATIIVRFVLLGIVLTLASLQGALPLLMTALGVFIARAMVLRQSRMALARIPLR